MDQSAMPDGRVPCGIIGLGRIGSLLEDDSLREKPATHAGAIHGNSRTYIASGCDIDPDARDAFKDRWSVDAVYEDPVKLLEHDTPQILCIATPTDTHTALVRLALKYDVPVVICEKPVTEQAGEGRRLMRQISKCKTRVLINHERRYAKDYSIVRNHIIGKTYGALNSVSARLFIGRSRPVSEIVLHDGTHMFDTIRFLTGCEISVSGIARHPRKDPHTVLISAAAGTSMVSLEIGSRRDHLVFELMLSFDRGRITIGNGVYREELSRQSHLYEGFNTLYDTGVEPVETTGYFSGMLEDAVRCVDDPKATPCSSYTDGVRALELIERVNRTI